MTISEFTYNIYIMQIKNKYKKKENINKSQIKSLIHQNQNLEH